MNKILKSGVMAVAGLAALAMTACVDDYSYTPSKDETGEQVYFSSNLGTHFDVDLNGNELIVPVNRENRAAAATVPVEISSTSGNGKLFTFPASEVSYNAGDSVAYLKFSYDASKMEYGKYDTITVKVANADDATSYGSSSYTFVAGASAYRDMAQMGYMRDGLVAPIFELTPETFPVKVQENVVEKGKYRIVNAYGNQKDNKWSYANVGSYDSSSDHYIEVDVSDPDYAYIIGGSTGRTLGSDGEIYVSSWVDYYLNEKGYSLDVVKANVPDVFGKFVDGVLTMPAKSILFGFGGTAFQYVAPSDQFAFALPGHEISDYSMTFEQTGIFTDTKKNSYVTGTFTLGADITSMKYTVTDDKSQVDNLYKGMILNQVEPLGELTASGDVKIPVTKSTTYYIVMAGYNGVDAVGSSVAEVKVELGGSEQETYKAVASGTYTLNYKDVSSVFWQPAEDGTPASTFFTKQDMDVTLYQGESDPTKFRIVPYLTDEDHPLDFTVDADGYITLRPQDTGAHVKMQDGSQCPIWVVDFYTQLVEEEGDTEFANKVAAAGWRSQYNSEKDMYLFTMNFQTQMNGKWAYFGATQYDVFQVIDRDESAAMAALAKAKKAARVKTYIFKSDLRKNMLKPARVARAK